MSSKKLIKLLEQAGAVFDREGRGDHIIYKREVGGKLLKAPVLESKKELPPELSELMKKLRETTETFGMMRLAESAFAEWDDPEEDIYNE